MSDMRDQKQIFDLLDRTLEAYGGDAARWPAGVRVKLSPFVDGNVEAQRRIAEVRALDKVLGFAPEISAARKSELANQIVARAARQPRTVSTSDTRVNTAPLGLAKSRLSSWRNHSLAAGALAASLMIGILAGQNATVVTLAETVLNGGETVETSRQQVAQNDDIEIFWDEDLL